MAMGHERVEVWRRLAPAIGTRAPNGWATAHRPLAALSNGPAVLWEIASPASNRSRRALEQRRIIGAVSAVLPDALGQHDIDDPLEIAHFLAQCAHESDAFATTVEYASGEAYEGRRDLGNTRPGDGPRFRGRGLIQLTGRANYRRYGRLADMDLEAEPERAADPAVSVLLACLYWQDRDIGPWARRDDIRAVTRRINGGLNGIADRRRYLRRAKAALGLTPARGADVVRRVQHGLVSAGLPVAVDGVLGPETRGALLTIQAEMGLPITGRPDDATLAMLAGWAEDGDAASPA